MSVFETLSAIDVNEHVKQKGRFSYLSWTWAWATVKQSYPTATYDILPDTVYPDDSVEVRMSVCIEGERLTMWLPVMDNSNNAIKNPDARDVSDTRMRCLVKCCAMHGLGHYIYAGESLPSVPGLSDDEFALFLELVAAANGLGLLKYMAELGEEKCNEAYNRAPKGQKVKFKDGVKAIQKAGQDMINQYVHHLEEAGANEDDSGVLELIAEINEDGAWLKGQVWNRLGEISKQQIKTIMGAAA